MSKTRMGKRVASLLLSLVMMLSLLPTTVYATTAEPGETEAQVVISEQGDQNTEDGNVPGEGETGTDDPQPAADNAEDEQGAAAPQSGEEGTDTALLAAYNAEGEENAVAPLSGEEGADTALLAAANVAKVGETEYATLDEAIAAAESGATVTLLSDITLTETLTISKNVTLDLNGNTMTVKTNSDGIVVSNATLTLANSGAEGGYVFDCSATNSDGIYVHNTDATTVSTLNINSDVSITVSAVVNSAIHAFGEQGSTVVNFVGGKIDVTGSEAQVSAIIADQNSEINVGGGEFNLNVDFNSYNENHNDVVGVLIWGAQGKQENIAVNITDGVFSVGGRNAFAQVVQVGMVNGYSKNCAVNISGGTITLNPEGDGTGYLYATYKTSYATAEISGGTVSGTVTAIVKTYISVTEIANDGVTISGGKFPENLEVADKYLADGYEYDPETGEVTEAASAAYVAQIGEKKYDTLAEAIAAAKDGDTVTLLADCSGDGIKVDENKFADQGLTVDFDGHSYTVGGVLVGSSGTASNGFQLLAGNKITFEHGTIYGDASVAGDETTEWTGAPAIMIQNYCDLTLKGMTVVGGKETCYTMSNNNGEVVIEDTTIEAGKGTKYGPFAFDVCRFSIYPSVTVTVKGSSRIEGNVEISGTIGADQSRQLNIEGGTFTGTFSVVNQPANIAISGGTFSEKPDEGYLAEGFTIEANSDGTYGVKEGADGYVEDENGNVTISTEAGLFWFAKQVNEKGNTFSGKTVTLAEDITLTERWTPIGIYTDSKTHFKGTFDGQNHTVSGVDVLKYGANGVGFFGKVYTGTVKNLTVEGTVTAHGCNYVGGIVGHGYATITNCTFKGTITNDGGYQVGGIAGSGGFTIKDCAVYGDISAESWVGGIIGNAQDGGASTNCYVEGTISANSAYAGASAAGIAAIPLYTTQKISGCYSNTVVKCGDEEINAPIIGAYNSAGVTADTELYIYDNSWNKAKNPNDSYEVKDGTTVIEGKTVSRDNNLVMLEDDLKYVSGDLSNVRIMSGSTVTQEQVDALAVAEAGGKKYTSLKAAVAAAESGQTVKLLADVTADVKVDKNITLDLNGKTLTGTDTSGTATVTIAKGATATVQNGTILGTANSYYTIQNNGTATLEGVTATAGNTGSSMIDNWGTMTIKSGTYTGGLNVVKSEEDSTLTINGGKFTLGYATSGYTGVIFAYGTTTITGGEFIQSLSTTGQWNHPQVILAGVVEGYTSSVTVTGGSFTNNLSSEAIFRGVGKATSDNFKVSGGTFNKSISDSYCAEGFIPTKNSDGTYSVKKGSYVAAIGSTNYETLEAAITAAKKGKTVKLLTDVEQNSELSIDKSITLDLAGHKIYNTVDIWDEKATPHVVALINIEKGANVTITGDGTIAAKENDCYAINLTEGNLTIENGIFVGNVSAVQVEKGTLTIKDGHFSLLQKWENSSKYLINCIDDAFADGTAKVAIYGGTFADFDPNVSPEAKVDGKVPSFVAEGVGVDKDESGNFIAKAGMTAQIVDADGNSVKAYETLKAAVEAAENGQTVKLLANCESERIDLEKKSVKVDLNGKTLTSTAAYDVMFCAKNGNTINIDGTTEGSKLVGTLMVTAGTDGHIVINGGTYENAEYCPIYVNGAVSSDESTVTIKDATVIALAGTSDQDNGAAIYLAGYAVSKFTNVTVSAPVTGIEIRAGKLTLDNCDVTGGKGEIAESANGNGTTVKNAALAISQHNTKKVIDVTINGGTYTGTAALYQTDVQGTGSADVKAEVKSGTFIGIVEAKTSGTIAISGGTFNSEVPEEYCAEGYIPTKNEDGTYTVAEFKPFEIWTGFSGTKVAAYKTLADAVTNLGENKWLVIAKDYTLSKDFTIPEGVFLDVAKGATLTVAEGVTLTVAKDAKRLGVRAGATVVNNGTILVCGTDYSCGYVMLPGTLTGNALSVPDGYFLDNNNNNNNFFATANGNAVYEITFADGTVKLTTDSTNIKGGNVTQVKLLKDVTKGGWTFDASVGPEVVFDLNGHTVSYDGANRYYATLNISTKVTIKNGTVRYDGTARGAIDLYGSGELIIEADAVINGGESFGIFTSGTSKLTVSGTVTSSGNYAIAGNGSENSGSIDNCDITVNEGAEISATNGIAIYHPQLGTVTVNGGTITGHTGIQMCAGKLVVSGGKITSTGDNKDHTDSQNAMMDGAAISIVNRNYPGGVPTAEIRGGTFKASGEGALAIRAYDYTNEKVADWTDAGEYVNISGGTFSSIPENMTALCAEGYIPELTPSGAYEVVTADYVAEIGDTRYTSLANAIAAAKDGETVKLIANFSTDATKTTATDRLIVGKSITLDLNGYKMTIPGELEPTDNWAAFYINGGTLTVKDSTKSTGAIIGADKTEENPKYRGGVYLFHLQSGNLVIENGTFYAGGTVANVRKGTATINGGKFSVYPDVDTQDSRYLLNCIDKAFTDGDAHIIVNGGTFEGFDPRNNAAEGKGTSFVAEGVGVNADADGNFVAKANMLVQLVDAEGNSVAAYDTLWEAFTDAKDLQNTTLIVLQDITDSDPVYIDATNTTGSITLDLNDYNISFIENEWSEKHSGFNIQNATALDFIITGKGTITAAASNIAAIRVQSSSLSTKTTLTIEKDVTAIGHTGVMVDKYQTVAPGGNGITVNIAGTVKSVNNGIGVYVNGSITEQQPVINVMSTARIEADSWGMYLAGNNKTTVASGAQISGTGTGIEIRAGELTLNDCTVTGGSGELWANANGSGTTVGNAAVAVSQHNTNLPITVTVNGGTYTGTAAFYQFDGRTDTTGTSGEVKTSITRGTFLGQVAAETGVLVITGGCFSADVTKYCATGYQCNLPTADEPLYTVTKKDAVVTVSRKLTLANNLIITYTAKMPTDYAEPYAEFNFWNNSVNEWQTSKVEGISTGTDADGNATYTFAFTGVNPQRMNDTLKMTLFAKTPDSSGFVAITKEYTDSVAAYCNAVINNSTYNVDGKWTEVLSNLVAYGAASQKYMKYNETALVTDSVLNCVTKDYTETQEITKVSGVSRKDGGITITSVGMVLSSSYAVRVFFTLNDTTSLSDVTFTASIGGSSEQHFSKDDFTEQSYNGGTRYYFDYTGLNARQLDSEITFTATVSGTQDDTLGYSANTYLQHYITNNPSANTVWNELVKWLFNYGWSCKNFK